MSPSTYFVQECPTCGRRLHIRVEYLGRRVVCQHCHGALIAADPVLQPRAHRYDNHPIHSGGGHWEHYAEHQLPHRVPHPR
jgi:hypothetical protein